MSARTSAPATDPPTLEVSGGFRADIQGLRGVAVLLVVAYHSDVLLSGGFVGVDVFFVVSGYVISRMLVRELQVADGLDFRRFYLRRIRRILPAVGVMLALTLILSAALVPVATHAVTVRTGFAAALINANTYLIRPDGVGGYFEPGAETNPLLHMWSLSVEEQFYLIFPAILVMAWRWGRHTGRAPLATVRYALAAIVALSLPLSLALSFGLWNPAGLGLPLAFYSAPTRAWEFAVGGLLLAGATRSTYLNRTATAATTFGGFLLIAWAGFRFDESTVFPGSAALLPVIGTALLLVAGESAVPSLGQRLLTSRWLQFVGDVSYSWYLWHWPVIVFAKGIWPAVPWIAPAAAVVSLVPAVVSQRLVENPIRHGLPRAGRTLGIGALCVAVPITAAAALEIGKSQLASLTRPAFEAHGENMQSCDPTSPWEPLGGLCQPAPGGPNGVFVLVGDSNAGQFSEGFSAAANNLGYDAVVVSISACPFTSLTVFVHDEEDQRCTDFVAEFTAVVGENPVSGLVIAMASDIYVEHDQFALLSRGAADRARTPEAKAELWAGGLADVVDATGRNGTKVAVIHPVPRLPVPWKPIEMPIVRHLGPDSWMNRSVDRSDALADREAIVAVERAGAGDRAVTIDTFDVLCPNQRCAAWDGREWLYRDAFHISVAGSLELTSHLEAEFTRLLAG